MLLPDGSPNWENPAMEEVNAVTKSSSAGAIPWEPFDWLTTGDANFTISVMIAILFIANWGYRRFDVPTFNPDESDPVTLMRPSDLATPPDYTKGVALYIVLLIGGFCALLFLGPPVLQLIPGVSDQYTGDDLLSPSSFPLFLAIVLTGLVPNAPGLKDVESTLRQVGHRYAGIPSDVQGLANDLAEAHMDNAFYLRKLHLAVRDGGSGSAPLSYLTPEDLMAEESELRAGPWYTWTRLCCLAWGFRAEIASQHHSTALRKFGEKITAIFDEIAEVAADVEQVRALRGANPDIEMSFALRDRITCLHRRFAVLVVLVALWEMKNETEVRHAFIKIGFIIPSRVADIGIGDVGVVTSALLGAALLSLGVIWYLWTHYSEIYPQRVVPTTGGLIAALMANTFMQYLIAGMAPLYIRAWRISQRKWRDRPSDYAITVIWSMFITLMALMITDVVIKTLQGSLTLNFSDLIQTTAKNYLYYTPLMIAISFFVLLALKGCNSRCPPSRRYIEGAASGLVMAIIAFFTTIATMGVDLDSMARYQVDYVLYVTILAAVSGAIVGAVVPHGYRRAITMEGDSEAQERMQKLKAAVRNVLGSRTEDWMQTPNRSLSNLTPEEAVHFNAMTWDLDHVIKDLSVPSE
jgi:hypothetical protein